MSKASEGPEDGPATPKPGYASSAQQLLVEWNATETGYPADSCLHELFSAQVARTPQGIALALGEETMSYDELEGRSNQLAHYLASVGVGQGALVGVSLERSFAMVVGLLGILKAGAAYVPFDAAYPAERLRYMASDSGVSLIVTLAHLEEFAPSLEAKAEGAGRVVCLDSDWARVANYDRKPVASSVGPEDLAYVLYTSGTTGRPKGVMVTHRAVCNRVHRGQQAYPMRESDRMLQIASLNFDASVWEIFLPLMAGCRLVLAPPGAERDAARLVRLIAQHEITIVDFVPSMLRMLLEQPEIATCRALRRVFSGGEVLDARLVRQFFSCLDAELHNLYGPTEGTIDTTHYVCLPDCEDAVPIGRPIDNTQVYLLDQDLEPVPVGAEGELRIAGVSLARGYLNLPELTATAFVANPFSKEPGARLYRSGDLARYRPDGNIEFRGRIDHQVKIRGQRIELAEIETCLQDHPAVEEVVVVHRQGGERPIDSSQLLGGMDSLDDVEASRLIEELEALSEPETEFLLLHELDIEVRRRTMIRRHSEFEHYLRITDDNFVRPPKDSQRNWILHRLLDEFSDDLRHLNELARRFVPGSARPKIRSEWSKSEALYDDSQLVIDGQQVMQEWERPMMQAMADVLCEAHGDVVEIGFGMGISATMIQRQGVRSHTIIESNDDVIQAFEEWRAQYPDSDIRLLRGKWQDVVTEVDACDGVFFDAYSNSEQKFAAEVLESITFAEAFFPSASAMLRPGGVFTYYTNEIDSFSRRHQRLIFKYFESFNLSVVRSMAPPDDCNYWWADSMAVVKAIR